MFGLRKTNRKWYQMILRSCCMLGIAAVFTLSVHAQGQTQIMQSAVDGNNLYLYIREFAEESSLSGQIAQTKADVTDVLENVDIHTIILLDNSLSITESNQVKAREILSAYVQQKDETELVSIATFGEDVHYLAERETDADKLIEAMDSVVYENQDSFLSDILYDEIIKLEDNKEYTRFIVVADGVDNKAIGYTKEELQELLKKRNYPVYALGCIYKENTAELENFFSIARLTNGNYFLLDESEDTSEVVSALDETISRVTLEIPNECRDGGEKSILLSVEANGGVTELTDSASMPFGIKEEPVEEVEEPEEIEEPEVEEPEPVVVQPEPEEEPEEPEPEEDAAGIDPVTVAAAVAIVCAIIALIVQQIVKKNKNKDKTSSKKEKKEKKAKKEKNETVAAAVEIETPTVMVEEEERTMFLPQTGSGYIVVLKDKNDPDKIFRYPLMNRVVIGRKNENGVNIVLNYDSSVSGRHCEISVLGDHFYVEDLRSSNKTYLNGEIVEGRMEFSPGSSLRIGRLEMIVDVEKR